MNLDGTRPALDLVIVVEGPLHPVDNLDSCILPDDYEYLLDLYTLSAEFDTFGVHWGTRLVVLVAVVAVVVNHHSGYSSGDLPEKYFPVTEGSELALVVVYFARYHLVS